MKLDFSEFPVVDAHAHPFMPSREKKVYGRQTLLTDTGKWRMRWYPVRFPIV